MRLRPDGQTAMVETRCSTLKGCKLVAADSETTQVDTVNAAPRGGSAPGLFCNNRNSTISLIVSAGFSSITQCPERGTIASVTLLPWP